MASRKFKQDWIPTPLRADSRAPVQVALHVLPAGAPPQASREKTAAQNVSAQATSALTSVAALASTHTSAAGAAFASAANSTLAAARSTAAGAALASVASSALTSARDMAGTAIAAASTAANSALTAGRASAAASILAAALGPIPSPVGLVNRASFILKFFFKWFLLEIWRSVVSIFRGKRERSAASGRDAREFVERLGGMWVILARLAALRGDLLGVEYCQELGSSRDLATPVPFKEIRQTVEEDLRKVGTTFEETFLEFDETPHTVRSFNQVHRARLKKNKSEVLVRIRTPDALQRVKTDWRYLRVLLFFVEQLDIEPHLRWDDLMFEVKKVTDDLLDLRTEVEELRHVRKILRKRHIYVPLIHRRYCTERVMVLEDIRGVSVADLVHATHSNPYLCDEWMHENHIDHRRVWRRIFNVHHELLFEHSMFYTELNPNNIILLKNNQLAFVSLGTIGLLDTDLKSRYRHLYRAFIEEDYTKACDYYLTLGPALPYKDITNMKQMSVIALRKWESRTHVKNRPYSEKSLGSAVGELARCASAQQLPTFWNLARLQLAEKILNTSLEFFDPTKSSIKALKRYEHAAQIRTIKNATTKNLNKRIEGASDTAQLTMQLLENFENDGEYLRRRLTSVSSKLSKASAIVGRMVMLIAKLAVVALALQAFLYFRDGHPLPWATQGTLGRVMNALHPQSKASWIILVLVLLYSWRFLAKLARQLFTKEVRPSDVA